MNDSRSRIFISYSSHDRDFVLRLAADLERERLPVWIDRRNLQPGDSIVTAISEALSDSDYVVVVISRHSVASKWVQAEMNAALFRDLSNAGVVVLPVLIEDCALPVLLADRVFADFRESYDSGLAALKAVFRQEATPNSSARSVIDTPIEPHQRCVLRLAAMSDADIRRLLHSKLGRAEIRAVWHAVFASDMEDDMLGREKLTCALELVMRCRRSGKMKELYAEICIDHPSIV